VLTVVEVDGSIIPEVVPVECVVLETKVATKVATETAEVAAPGWPKSCVAMPCRN
jgi:hypothetical protein